MAKSRQSTPTWHTCAVPTGQRRDAWRSGRGRSVLEPLGEWWDAVALTPLAFGLHVLTGMRLSPRAGYPVIGDLGHDTAYVMVSPHSADGAPVVDGVRVLGAGHLLLVPDTVRTASPHGTFCAHWISAPRADRYERLVDGQTLAAHLHQLHSTHRKAPAS